MSRAENLRERSGIQRRQREQTKGHREEHVQRPKQGENSQEFLEQRTQEAEEVGMAFVRPHRYRV